jgi:hypothetical protein
MGFQLDLIQIAVLLLGMTGWTLAARDYFKLRFASAVFTGIQVLILAIYVFSLFNLLLPGLVACEIVGVLYLGLSLKRNKPKFSTKSILTFFMYSAPLFVFVRAVPRDFRFTMSDEFPSWAANIKTMYAEDALGGANSATREIASGFYQSYPPFQQIFQYIFLKNTFWSEANTQIAQNILVLLSLLGVVSFLTTRNQSLTLFTWAGAIVIYFLFGFTMSNLLADGLLAVQFAAALGIVALQRSEGRINFLQGILIANLSLIKPTGFVFALCAAVFVVSHLFARTYNGEAHQSNLGFLSSLRKTGISTGIVLLPAAVSYISWQIHLRRIDVTPGVESFSFATIRTSEFKNRWIETISSYKDNFFGSLHGPDNLAGITLSTPKVVEILNISLFSIIVVLAVVHFVIAATTKGAQRNSSLINALIFIALAIFYQFFLIFLYMFFFGEYEGVRSAALVRYSSSFLLAWAIFVFALVVIRVSDLKWKTVTLPIIGLALLLIAPAAFSNEIRSIEPNPTKLAARLDVEKITPQVLNQVDQGEKTYFIYQKSDGFEKYIFSYLILPLASNWACPSLGAPYYEGDVWTCSMDLPEALQGYDFLAVGNGDARFWAENAKYLEAGSAAGRQGLYRVSLKEGELSLSSIA